MNTIVKIMPLVALVLSGCKVESPKKKTSDEPKTYTVQSNVQGYYEALVTANNGDKIVLSMLVKPNGEYFGSFNNFFGTYKKKDVFSLYSGFLTQRSSDPTDLFTKLKEFNDANGAKQLRAYNAYASYVPKTSFSLDLRGTDANIDHKRYRLAYSKLNGLPLNRFTGTYNKTILQVGFRYSMPTMYISNTANPHSKKIELSYTNNCRFEGAIVDNNYDLSFYDYSGSFSGSNCQHTGQYSGVVYVNNDTFVMMGTDQNKLTEMGLLKNSFKK